MVSILVHLYTYVIFLIPIGDFSQIQLNPLAYENCEVHVRKTYKHFVVNIYVPHNPLELIYNSLFHRISKYIFYIIVLNHP
jgi:hypothetical protein